MTVNGIITYHFSFFSPYLMKMLRVDAICLTYNYLSCGDIVCIKFMIIKMTYWQSQ